MKLQGLPFQGAEQGLDQLDGRRVVARLVGVGVVARAEDQLPARDVLEVLACDAPMTSEEHDLRVAFLAHAATQLGCKLVKDGE